MPPGWWNVWNRSWRRVAGHSWLDSPVWSEQRRCRFGKYRNAYRWWLLRSTKTNSRSSYSSKMVKNTRAWCGYCGKFPELDCTGTTSVHVKFFTCSWVYFLYILVLNSKKLWNRGCVTSRIICRKANIPVCQLFLQENENKFRRLLGEKSQWGFCKWTTNFGLATKAPICREKLMTYLLLWIKLKIVVPWCKM